MLTLLYGLIVGALFGAWQKDFMAALFMYNFIFFLGFMLEKNA